MDILEIDPQKVSIETAQYSTESIEKISNGLSYSDFFHKYFLLNRPCVIKNLSRKWPCSELWIDDKSSSLNVELFKTKYGQSEVPIADCKRRAFNVQEKCTMRLTEYLDYWKDPSRRQDQSLYLKDWHFTKDYPLEKAYRVPSYFSSDWLNEYYTVNMELNDDYRFLYLGPKGSWTPLHVDVFTSYSWSVNIFGRKKWILIKPGDETYFTSSQGSLIYDLDALKLSEGISKGAKVYEIIQGAGEGIFVPSGWHHQVWNLEDTLSINHNCINGCNIHNMWYSLKKNLCEVKTEIWDCRDMDNWLQQCQLVLRASFGFNYSQFYSLLVHVAVTRLKALNYNEPFVVYGNWRFGKEHLLFDLKQVLKVLELFVKDEDVLSFGNELCGIGNALVAPLNFLENLRLNIEKLTKF